MGFYEPDPSFGPVARQLSFRLSNPLGPSILRDLYIRISMHVSGICLLWSYGDANVHHAPQVTRPSTVRCDSPPHGFGTEPPNSVPLLFLDQDI